jgi:hypothetical protein
LGPAGQGKNLAQLLGAGHIQPPAFLEEGTQCLKRNKPDELIADNLPNPSLITEIAKTAAMIWIMKGGLGGGQPCQIQCVR